MSASFANAEYAIDPPSAFRNPKFLEDHEQLASLLCRVVVAGLLLGGVGFVQAAGAGAADEILLRAGVAIVLPCLLVAFVLWSILVAFRPWSGLAVGLGCAVAAFLVFESAVRLHAPHGSGSPTLPFLQFQILSVAYAIFLTALPAAYLSYRLNRVYGLFASLLLLTSPAMPGADRVSLWLSFYGTGSLLCLFLWCETRKPLWLVTGGLSLGMAASGLSWKWSIFVVALGLATLVFLSRREGWARTARYALLLFLLSVAPFGIWELIGGRADSIHLFPQAVFLHEHASGASLPFTSGGDATGAAMLAAIVQSIAAAPLPGEARLPAALIIGPAAVGFLPWAFRGQRGYEKRTLAVIALVIVLVTGSASALKSVGLVPIIPLLGMLATYGIHNLYMNVKRPALLWLAVIVLLVWNSITLWTFIA